VNEQSNNRPAVIVVAPKGVKIADYLAAAAVGIDLDASPIMWPRAAYSEDPSKRRRNYADAYAAAQDYVRRCASVIAQGREIHVVIGTGAQFANVTVPKVDDDGNVLTDKDGAPLTSVESWANVVNPDALRDIASVATKVYVAAGSDDPNATKE
jgi:hypothetical protein